MLCRVSHRMGSLLASCPTNGLVQDTAHMLIPVGSIGMIHCDDFVTADLRLSGNKVHRPK